MSGITREEVNEYFNGEDDDNEEIINIIVNATSFEEIRNNTEFDMESGYEGELTLLKLWSRHNASRNGLSRADARELVALMPMFTLDDIMNVDLNIVREVIMSDTHVPISAAIDILNIIRGTYVKKIQQKAKKFIYEPGRARESTTYDSFLQAVENVPEHLLFCRTKTRDDILDAVNSQLQMLYSFDANLTTLVLNEIVKDYEGHLLSDAERKILDDEEPSFSELKKSSKRIVIRMSKYELCQVLLNINEDLNIFMTKPPKTTKTSKT